MDELLKRIDAEAIGLLRVFFGVQGLALLAVVAVIWGLAMMIKKALRLRTGVISQHPLANPTVNGLALLATVAVFVRQLFGSAPLILTVVLVSAASAMVFGLGLRSRAWLAGLIQVLSSRLSIGDRLSFDVATGVVERISLFRITLRAEGGELLHVPVAALDGRSFAISSPQRDYPVDVSFHFEDVPDKAVLAGARTAARLCPYRAVDSDAAVVVDADNPRRLNVRFRAWSEQAARHAENYLRSRVV